MRLAILCSFVLLTACGQSGDLYLPSEPPAQPEAAAPTAPAETAPAPVEEKKDKQ
jgi:predicted small lipoprotein YifL